MKLKPLSQIIRKYKKALAKMETFKTDSVAGSKVRITKKYAKWLKINVDSLHSLRGEVDKKDKSYQADKYLAKKRPIGKVISATYDKHGNDFDLTVEFKDKHGKKFTEKLDLGNIKEV